MNNGSVLDAPNTKRLNLGAGKVPVPGFVDIDRSLGSDVYPLPYENDSIAEIRASHILEHFPYEKVIDVLKEWVRVLKPGGLIKIAVPDFRWIVHQYLDPKAKINVQGLVMGGHLDGNDAHQVIFDEDVLTSCMHEAGIIDVNRWESEVTDCAALPVSLNLQGRKAYALPKLKIACAMSVPRLGFQDNFFCWVRALMPLGIEPSKYAGAFWGQCLERVMSEQMDSDFILTIDYDSLFDRQTVEQLIRTAWEHPEGDAFVSVQMKRESEHPLLTIQGDDGKLLQRISLDEFKNKPLTKIHTGHFGLTLIRTASLKKVPHPWFLGVPNKEGTWGEGRIDEDIYFWKKLAELGMTVYSANRCVIGHGEFVVTWPGREFNLIYQHPNQFWDDGPPEDVWT